MLRAGIVRLVWHTEEMGVSCSMCGSTWPLSNWEAVVSEFVQIGA